MRRERESFQFRPKHKDGIASTITTRPDRATETYIIEKEDKDFLINLIPAPKLEPLPFLIDYDTAYGICTNNSIDYEKYPLKDLARTLLAQTNGNGVIYNGKIRKLMPIESFRLMGFSDEDYHACKAVGISETQLYKQAGNSICIPILVMLFKNLFMPTGELLPEFKTT